LHSGVERKLKECKVAYKQGEDEYIMFNPKLRSVLKEFYDENVKEINFFVALCLSASVPNGYFVKQGCTLKEADTIGLRLSKSFATRNSKMSYGEENTSKPNKSTRTRRAAYMISQELREIIMDQICFSGTIEEFNTSLGWMATRNTLIKSVQTNKALPCPFSYQDYAEDVKRMHNFNERKKKEAVVSNTINDISILLF